jgi:hypothetical protein
MGAHGRKISSACWHFAFHFCSPDEQSSAELAPWRLWHAARLFDCDQLGRIEIRPGLPRTAELASPFDFVIFGSAEFFRSGEQDDNDSSCRASTKSTLCCGGEGYAGLDVPCWRSWVACYGHRLARSLAHRSTSWGLRGMICCAAFCSVLQSVLK